MSTYNTKALLRLMAITLAVTFFPAMTAVSLSAQGPFLPTGSRMSVVLEGSGAGLVVGHGINCKPVCEGRFHGNFTLTLAATADAGSRFGGWSGGGCSGTGLCTVTLTTDTTVTATFTSIPLTIYAVTPDANGSSRNPAASTDGSVVAFESTATNLARNCNTRTSLSPTLGWK